MGSSRSRKHKLEPITMEELANTAGMSGFVSFFTNPLLQPTERLGEGDGAISTTPVESTPVVSTHVEATPDGTAKAHVLSAHHQSTSRLQSSSASKPLSTPVESTRVEATGVNEAPTGYIFRGIRGKRHVREARVAQDGHSLGEQVVCILCFAVKLDWKIGVFLHVPHSLC